MEPEITGIILAGGENTRMRGNDKAFLKINGAPIIARIIDKLKALTGRMIVVTNSPQKYAGFDVQAVRDERPGLGPLMGIYSGLKASLTKHNFVVACDMPFLNAGLIEYIIDKRNDYDIVVPEIGGKYHPLFGIYSKDCVPVIENMLKQDNLRIANMFPELKTHFITKQEVEIFDKDLFSLANINTEDDFKNVLGT